MTFVKHDNGKARYDLIDADFEQELAEVLTHGATKYTDNNWQNARVGEARARYYAAFRRHTAAWRRGEELDPDSGLPHLVHAACCLMFLRWFERAEEASVEELAEALAQRIEDRKEQALAEVDNYFDDPEAGADIWRVPL